MRDRWSRLVTRPWFGDVVIVAFLAVQALDGILTYMGVLAYGQAVEGNPLIRWLMGAMGEGPGVTGAKVMAGTFGIALHLTAVHRLIAALTAMYLGAAVLPWIAILFF